MAAHPGWVGRLEPRASSAATQPWVYYVHGSQRQHRCTQEEQEEQGGLLCG